MVDELKSGRALKRTGMMLIIISVILNLISRVASDDAMDEGWFLISVILISMLLLGVFLFFRGRQHIARASAEKIIGDQKADILYLRTFQSDPSTAGQVFSSMLTPNLMAGLTTVEEQLKEALRPIGDLVAIGRPGEKLPAPGAARMYASDNEWKSVVTDQMKAAKLVIIRAGGGEGLLWELERAFEILDPEKVLILILNMKKKHYRSFSKELHRIVGASLAEGSAYKRGGRYAGFIRFSSGWQPEFLPLRAPVFRSSAYKPFRRSFTFTLRPVFENLGVEWRKPPLSALTILCFMVLIIILLFIISISVCD